MKNELAEKVILLKKRIDFLEKCRDHLLEQKRNFSKLTTTISFMSTNWIKLYIEQHYKHCDEALNLVGIELSHNLSKLENL